MTDGPELGKTSTGIQPHLLAGLAYVAGFVSGLIVWLVEKDNRSVILRGLDGQNIALDRKEIVELKTTGMSLMPEGLLASFDDQQLRDLFAYLRSTQPLSE